MQLYFKPIYTVPTATTFPGRAFPTLMCEIPPPYYCPNSPLVYSQGIAVLVLLLSWCNAFAHPFYRCTLRKEHSNSSTPVTIHLAVWTNAPASR